MNASSTDEEGDEGDGAPASAGGSAGFVDTEPDPNGKCYGLEPCSIWDPDSCAEGEKCTLASCEPGSGFFDSEVCRPITGDVQEGEPCVWIDAQWSYDTCGDGMFCWDPDPDSGVGTCVAFCTGTPDEPSCSREGWICNMWKEVGSMCTPPCMPFEDDCPTGCSCQTPSSAFGEFTCMPAQMDPAPMGEPCDYDSACGPGSLCVWADGLESRELCVEGRGCCTRYCDLEAEAPCPEAMGSEVCVPRFPDEPDPDLARIGACMIPS